jgi:hypothetical protein
MNLKITKLGNNVPLNPQAGLYGFMGLQSVLRSLGGAKQFFDASKNLKQQNLQLAQDLKQPTEKYVNIGTNWGSSLAPLLGGVGFSLLYNKLNKNQDQMQNQRQLNSQNMSNNLAQFIPALLGKVASEKTAYDLNTIGQLAWPISMVFGGLVPPLAKGLTGFNKQKKRNDQLNQLAQQKAQQIQEANNFDKVLKSGLGLAAGITLPHIYNRFRGR